MIYHLLARNGKRSALRVVALGSNGIVVCSTLKHHLHSTIGDRIWFVVNKHQRHGRLNGKDHKLRLVGGGVYIYSKRYAATIDINIFLVAHTTINNFQGVSANKYILDCKAIRAVGLALKHSVNIDISICHIAIYDNAVGLVKTRKHFVLAVTLKVECHLITLAKFRADKVEAGIWLCCHLKYQNIVVVVRHLLLCKIGI